MKCTEEGCVGGVLEEATCCDLVGATDIACPCSSCGRLHWKADGKPVFNEKPQHDPMFMDEEGRIVDAQGEVTTFLDLKSRV